MSLLERERFSVVGESKGFTKEQEQSRQTDVSTTGHFFQEKIPCLVDKQTFK
jgi:hypothetical protein